MNFQKRKRFLKQKYNHGNNLRLVLKFLTTTDESITWLFTKSFKLDFKISNS